MTDPLVEEARKFAGLLSESGAKSLLLRLAGRVEELETAIADGERYATEYGFDTSHRIRARLRQALSTHPTESETG